MTRPRFARLAAALFGLLVGAFALLGVTPAASASQKATGTSVVKGQIELSVRYGCSNRGWVEARVRIHPGNDNAGTKEDNSSSSLMPAEPVQVGFTLTGSGADARYATGGPVLVAVDNTTTLVRLASPPPAGAQVFATRLSDGSTTVVDLPAACSSGSPTNFRMQPATVEVASATCVGTTVARAVVTVTNPNERRVGGGPRDVDYTVLSFEPDSRMISRPGQLLRFPAAGTMSTDVAVPADGGAYEIRVIGLDGSVVTAQGNAPDCGPTSSEPPSSSAPPSSSEPPASSTPPASSEPPASQTSQPEGPVTTPATEPGETGVVVPTGTRINPPPPSTTRATARPQVTASSTPPAVPSPSPSNTVEPRTPRYPPLLANSPSPKSSFKLQPSAAVVVLVDAVAIGALVVGTMQVARRR